MSAVDASTRGRRNRAKGNAAERAVANWLKTWYPDACRAVRNTIPDPGDIDCTSPGLFWSVKDTQVERIPLWMSELETKRDGRLGLLVVRRKGHASPGNWWCWMWFHDLMDITGGSGVVRGDCEVRMELRHVMPLLVAANYAPAPREVA